MTDSEFDPLRAILAELGPQGRPALLPALHAAQRIYGWLAEPVLSEVGRALHVPLADLYGVIDFYAMFQRQPAGRTMVRVCSAPVCALAGAELVSQALGRDLQIEPGVVSSDGGFTVEYSPCLGLCDRAPALLVNEAAVGDADPADAAAICAMSGPQTVNFVGGDIRILTSNCGQGHPTSLANYQAQGGHAGLKTTLTMTPRAVLAEVKASGLVGRGGAAFPTGVKWEGAAKAPGTEKYVICNADESAAGTFKDRILLIDDPHRTIEGMLIAGYAIGARKGYIYIRAEYPYILPVLENALNEAREARLLGENILGSGFSFDIEIRVGAGAYICGEETALFESIEGKRGFPRVKPPFPTTHGLFGKPTVINNVETLCNVPLIISQGSAEFRRIGTEKSPGPKLFCVSGDVEQPGLYEVPFGVTLRELLEMAGGVPENKNLQAVLFGGAAGAFATSQHLDVKMTFEDLRAAGLPLGSGVVMVFDETRDMRASLKELGHFFAHESCGKCYPCQIGTQRQKEILERISNKEVLSGDLVRLEDVGWTMTDASLCGLGQ